MKKQKSLKMNFLMNALLSMSSFVFPIITFPYVTRILHPTGTGKVNFATSFIAYFTMFAQLGIPTYGIRACAVVRDDKEKLTKTAHELLCINLICSFISYAALFILLFTVPKLQDDRTLCIVVSLNIILTTIGMEWLYKAMEQYTYITVRSIIFKFVALISMFLFVKDEGDCVIYGAISIFASGASNVFNFINVHRYISMRPLRHYELRKHLKAVGIFFAMSCATTIYTHLDTVMIKFMTTDADVGYYSAATKVKVILVSIVTSLGAVLLPRASYYIQKNMINDFRVITSKALNFVMVFSIPLALYFIIYAKEGVLFLSGSEYDGAVIPMQIIMPTLVFIGLTNILGIQILVPLGKEKQVLYSEIIGAIVDLALNIALIPRYHSAGAALGTLAAELAVFIYQYVVLRHEVKPAMLAIKYGKIVLALIVGALCSTWVKLLGINSFFTLLISACLFFGSYGGILLLLKEPFIIEITRQFLYKFFNHSRKAH